MQTISKLISTPSESISFMWHISEKKKDQIDLANAGVLVYERFSYYKMTRGLGTGLERSGKGVSVDKCVNRVRRPCKSKPRCKKGHKWRGNRVSRGGKTLLYSLTTAIHEVPPPPILISPDSLPCD